MHQEVEISTDNGTQVTNSDEIDLKNQDDMISSEVELNNEKIETNREKFEKTVDLKYSERLKQDESKERLRRPLMSDKRVETQKKIEKS